MIKKHYLLINMLLLMCTNTFGQTWQLHVLTEDTRGKSTNIKYELADSVSAINQLNTLFNGFLLKGYFEAVSEFAHTDTTKFIQAHIKLGNLYEWEEINLRAEEPFLRGVKKTLRKSADQSFDYTRLEVQMKQLLRQYENNGYPFAKIQIQRVKIDNELVTAEIAVEKGMLIAFDSIIVQGTQKVDPKFLASWLGIKEGKHYDQKLINEVPMRAKQLNYLRYVSSELRFGNERAALIITVEERKVNSLDGVIGFLPNEQEQGSLLITGQVNAHIENLFSQGGILDFDWQRLRPSAQTLQMAYSQPNIFHSPFHLNSAFDLIREDSTFLKRSFQMGLGQHLGSRLMGTVYYENKFSNSLSGIQGSLNDIQDFNINQLGLSFNYHSINDIILPTSGLVATISASMGVKEIMNFAQLPSDINIAESKSLHAEIELAFENYVPLHKRWILMNRLHAGTIINESLFVNDLYRLGGLNSIRGFNQFHFFASDFSVLTTEARFLLDKSSYLLVLADQALIQYRTFSDQRTDFVASFGAGFSFLTNGGTFTFIYALGRSANQSFDFNLSKIHFGYQSRF